MLRAQKYSYKLKYIDTSSNSKNSIHRFHFKKCKHKINIEEYFNYDVPAVITVGSFDEPCSLFWISSVTSSGSSQSLSTLARRNMKSFPTWWGVNCLFLKNTEENILSIPAAFESYKQRVKITCNHKICALQTYKQNIKANSIYKIKFWFL